ncbi:MAG: phospho-N-acetylmuramoyl-pentapeptide-transferase [FCB group bacterium]|nr:phospho-N-acetylmuramoyl-pentapeptide-transferase [FCB group bacterium]
MATWLEPYYSAFNVFSYHTVRAGAAAVTAFAVSLIIGPKVIAWLRMLKVGQYIKQEHVADLHALHKGKAGTPTMGGMLIILSTLFTCLLWSRLSNRLVVLAMLMLVVLGTLGFIDDYIKLRRKHNQGLSAKAKSVGQILAGILLGIYLTYNPITVSSTNLAERDVVNWPGFVSSLAPPHRGELAEGKAAVWAKLPAPLQAQLSEAAATGKVGGELASETVHELNILLDESEIYNAKVWSAALLNGEGKRLLKDGPPRAGQWEHSRLNRMLLEAAYPQYIVRSERNLHTKVAVPSFKEFYIPMGALYVLFVVILIFSSSNAVNLTDGLDGLAIGASIISLLVYTGIAYVVSRVDWSNYLFLTYVPEASELTVFGAAMLGSGLGFLWYNSHPAEVFMGDTGSLALGGAIGTMALLTKQELLLILVGGLFVMEAGSVVLQVASFKLRGKRIFRMAPLHHHFELKGWSESKVIIRFWILAILFALMSLATLKLR